MGVCAGPQHVSRFDDRPVNPEVNPPMCGNNEHHSQTPTTTTQLPPPGARGLGGDGHTTTPPGAGISAHQPATHCRSRGLCAATSPSHRQGRDLFAQWPTHHTAEGRESLRSSPTHRTATGGSSCAQQSRPPLQQGPEDHAQQLAHRTTEVRVSAVVAAPPHQRGPGCCGGSQTHHIAEDGDALAAAAAPAAPTKAGASRQ